MAFLVHMTKIKEDADSATYSYTGAQGHNGILKIDKTSGQAELLETSSGDERGHFFQRAAAKLRQEWRSGRIPDNAQWAS